MATSSFDKKFVVKDPVVVEKVLMELEMIDEEKVLKSTETIIGGGSSNINSEEELWD